MSGLSAVDGKILAAIQHIFVWDPLTPVVTFITHLGNSGFIWIVLTVILLFIKKYRPVGLLSGASLASEYLVCNIILKNVVARTRPYEALASIHLLIEKQPDFSFPSGHSASAFAAATVMFIMLPRRYGVPALIFAFIIAFTRLYVGVHYPTDVLAGALAGTFFACLYCWLYRKRKSKGLNVQEDRVER